MEKREQVFVSSTFLDLQEERAAVVSALLQLDAFPAGMELFPAADDDAWTLIERVIESSDYYLLVVGGKYGSLDPATEISFTEREYDYAVSLGRPVLAFLHQDPDGIPLGRSEKDEAARQKLAAFRKKVETKKHVKYWSNKDDLAGRVALSFSSFRKTYPAIGWIRGDTPASSESLAEINRLRTEIADLETQLRSVQTGPPPGTEDLSQGDDIIPELVVEASTGARTKSEPYTTTTLTVPLEPEVAWDELFSAVGPSLLDEINQESLRSEINRWLTQEFGGRVRREARSYLEEEGETVQRFRQTQVQVTRNTFGTILVQLRALGLITKSQRRRSVRDRGTYWELTSYGDTHLTTLRAIRRHGDHMDIEPEEEEEEEEE